MDGRFIAEVKRVGKECGGRLSLDFPSAHASCGTCALEYLEECCAGCVELRYLSQISNSSRRLTTTVLVCAVIVLGSTRVSAKSNQASVPSAHSSSNTLATVDTVIQEAIHAGNIPGAVLIVGHNSSVVYRKAYGNRALEPRREAMTLDTVFDLASLTKVVATTSAIMQLFERGQVKMNDAVAKYLPEFGQNGKQDITVRQLLTHYSGLAPDLD